METLTIEKARRLIGMVTNHRVESRILIVFLTSAILIFGLGKFASQVIEGDTFAFDIMIMRLLRTTENAGFSIGPQWFTKAMIDVTALGGVTVLTLVSLFACGYLLAMHQRYTAFFLVGLVTLGALSTTVLKQMFSRVRPEVVPHLVPVDSASFPSGHAMNSALIYLTLAMLVARTENDRSISIYIVGSAVMTTLIVGSSRVYLGVHWPSDVVAGWGVGSLWAVLSTVTFKAIQKRRSPTEAAIW